jgi:CRISPR-associated Cas5-like protein
MSEPLNTLFLRLEGPLQAWSDTSKFVIRRTMEAPTKSGVIGLICCSMGVRRSETSEHPIPERFGKLRTLAASLLSEPETEDGRPRRTILGVLKTLAMGVRIDRAGTRWWDYHTVGAKIGILRADGKGIKRTGGGPHDPIETLISRREYLCDASFLVALQGDSELIKKVAHRMTKPQWPPFLGRKSCPPGVPIPVMRKSEGGWEALTEYHDNLESALASTSIPWCPRLHRDKPKGERIKVPCLIEWRPRNGDDAPPEAEVWYDAPVSFDPPVHEPRLVVRSSASAEIGYPTRQRTPAPPRPRANYSSRKWTDEIRPARLKHDKGLCVFCKQEAGQVHHASYRHAGGDESVEADLRSLCRLCHDAVTMIEYGLGMGLDRIDPCEPRWRDHIITKRDEIRRWRSEEGRRRALRGTAERLRRELLEEED